MKNHIYLLVIVVSSFAFQPLVAQTKTTTGVNTSTITGGIRLVTISGMPVLSNYSSGTKIVSATGVRTVSSVNVKPK